MYFGDFQHRWLCLGGNARLLADDVTSFSPKLSQAVGRDCHGNKLPDVYCTPNRIRAVPASCAPMSGAAPVNTSLKFGMRTPRS